LDIDAIEMENGGRNGDVGMCVKRGNHEFEHYILIR
jgi:hypothetical protein